MGSGSSALDEEPTDDGTVHVADLMQLLPSSSRQHVELTKKTVAPHAVVNDGTYPQTNAR